MVPQDGTAPAVNCHEEGWAKYLRATAKAAGLTYLGTIHTHNGNIHEEIPSGADNLGAIASGEYFFDIDSIHRQPAGRLRHDVKFWFPQRPINNTLK